MAVMPPFDLRSVGVGTAVGIAGTLPVLVAFQVADPGERSNLVFVLFAVVFAAWVAAGAVAARRRADAPYAHGLAAALGAWAAFAALRLAVLALRGPNPETDTPTTIVYVTFNGLVAATAGILGAIIAQRRPTHTTRRPLARTTGEEPVAESTPGEDRAERPDDLGGR